MPKSRKPQKPKAVEIVKSRYQPSPDELEEDMRIDASPEEVAKAVMRRVEVSQVPRPKPRSD